MIDFTDEFIFASRFLITVSKFASLPRFSIHASQYRISKLLIVNYRLSQLYFQRISSFHFPSVSLRYLIMTGDNNARCVADKNFTMLHRQYGAHSHDHRSSDMLSSLISHNIYNYHDTDAELIYRCANANISSSHLFWYTAEVQMGNTTDAWVLGF